VDSSLSISTLYTYRSKWSIQAYTVICEDGQQTPETLEVLKYLVRNSNLSMVDDDTLCIANEVHVGKYRIRNRICIPMLRVNLIRIDVEGKPRIDIMKDEYDIVAGGVVCSKEIDYTIFIRDSEEERYCGTKYISIEPGTEHTTLPDLIELVARCEYLEKKYRGEIYSPVTTCQTNGTPDECQIDYIQF
jgi:hypothetical protein